MKHARLALFALSLSLSVPLAFAQQPTDCRWTPNPTDPRSYSSVRNRLPIGTPWGSLRTVFLTLRHDLEKSPNWTRNEDVYAHLHSAFEFLDSQLGEFEQQVASEPPDSQLATFIHHISSEVFNAPVCIWFDVEGMSESSVVGLEDLALLTPAQAEDFRYRTSTANAVLKNLLEGARGRTLRGITAAQKRWTLFLEQGPSQYPWEVLVNAALVRADDIEHPPSHQWIALHPEAGVEVSTSELKDLRAKESLLIEVFGKAWYSFREKEGTVQDLRWWGIAGAASLREDTPPGIGLIVHYNRAITLGIVWHDIDADDDWFNDSPHVVFGLDLFRSVEKKLPEYRRRYSEIRERLGID